MSHTTPKQHRIKVVLDHLHSFSPARTALEAYAHFTQAINQVEDEFLGKDSYDLPRTFLDGTRTERMYMTLFENMYSVPRYGGVHILIHVREIVFISRYGAIEIQKKVEDDKFGFKQHFEERVALVIFKKLDAWGDGVWHQKNL